MELLTKRHALMLKMNAQSKNSRRSRRSKKKAPGAGGVAPDSTFTLRVRSPDGEDLYFKVKNSTKLKKARERQILRMAFVLFVVV